MTGEDKAASDSKHHVGKYVKDKEYPRIVNVPRHLTAWR
jgi:hypothetical protein